jgi:hypothetical protein
MFLIIISYIVLLLLPRIMNKYLRDIHFYISILSLFEPCPIHLWYPCATDSHIFLMQRNITAISHTDARENM